MALAVISIPTRPHVCELSGYNASGHPHGTLAECSDCRRVFMAVDGHGWAHLPEETIKAIRRQII